MSRDDWFRNTDWDSAIEAAFFARLNRARDKQQPLRIQAHTLAKRHPQAALRLLDEYFKIGEGFDCAQAHVDRASAYEASGEFVNAVKSYEAALAREAAHPNVKTQAYIDLPFLIASQAMARSYGRALQVLEEHQSRLTFPLEHFRWHAAYAFIAAAGGLSNVAREHAQAALDAASRDQSGFRNHPDIGVVGSDYECLRRKLANLTA